MQLYLLKSLRFRLDKLKGQQLFYSQTRPTVFENHIKCSYTFSGKSTHWDLSEKKKPKSIILQHYVQLSMLFHSKMILFECFSSVVRPHLSGEPRLQPRPRSHVLRTWLTLYSICRHSIASDSQRIKMSSSGESIWAWKCRDQRVNKQNECQNWRGN